MSDIDTQDAKLPLSAVVLAGGRSLRMGVDKTQLEIDGAPLVARVVNAVAPFVSEVIVVTNRPEELPLDRFDVPVNVMTDEVAYQGPLGGLSTALKAAKEEWVLTCAADMPWISEGIVRYLWEKHEGTDVVIPRGDNGPEPLHAIYRVKPAKAASQKVLASGKRRIIAMFPNLHVTEVPVEDLKVFDANLLSLFNVNTQEDLAKARKYARSGGAGKSKDEGDMPATLGQRRVRVMSAADTGRKMPSETPITIYLNDVEVATVQATASDLEDMAVGFLVAEGLIGDRKKLLGVDVDAKRGFVYVTSNESVPDDLIHKTRYVTSGCGKGVTFSSLGHARGMEPVREEVSVSGTDLYTWMAQMASQSEEYRERGGLHSCGLVIDGDLVLVREDIGRHNAVDKLLGHAWLEDLPIQRGILLSSGRISYEMIVKAAKGHIPIVASRSAATDLAADIADSLGITLCGYVRGGKVIAYTHPERIVD